MLNCRSISLKSCLPLFLVALPVCGVSLALSTPAAFAQATPTNLSASSLPVPSSQSVPTMTGDYVIAPDDQLQITVEGHSEFDKPVTVLPDGTFTYLGRRYHAAGSTIESINQRLTAGLKGQLRYPQVTVSVPQAHLRQISIVGKVRTPGQFNYKPGMTLIDALAACGGPAQDPEMTDATLWTDNATTPEPIDLVKLMSGQDPALNVHIQPGDVLSMQARNPATAMVLIRGQVGHEGEYSVRPEGATIMSMLAQAGGVTGGGVITHVQLTHDGQTRVLNLRPTLFDSTAPVGQTPVFAGDLVNVPLNNTKYMVLGEVANRSAYGLPDGEAVTVTKAMAQAGGPTSDADMKNVQIIRPGPNDTLKYITVNVDNVLQNKHGVDPVLQNGDILYFPKRGHDNSRGEANNILGNIFSFSTLSRLLRGGF